MCETNIIRERKTRSFLLSPCFCERIVFRFVELRATKNMLHLIIAVVIRRFCELFCLNIVFPIYRAEQNDRGTFNDDVIIASHAFYLQSARSREKCRVLLQQKDFLKINYNG